MYTQQNKFNFELSDSSGTIIYQQQIIYATEPKSKTFLYVKYK